MHGVFLHPLGLMRDLEHDSPTTGQADSQTIVSGLTSTTIPFSEDIQTGQSVDYVLKSRRQLRKKQWFAIRATQGRAKSVYEKLLALNVEDITAYLPTRKIKKVNYSDFNNPEDYIHETPLLPSLLFVNSTPTVFKNILSLNIPGLTPYYDKCHTNEFGYNNYLVIPDMQFVSFRRIVESEWDDIIVDQNEAPQFLVGDRVRVTEGPYEGIEGIVMKYKHQRRVFVQLEGIGCFGTGYIYKGFLEKI